jgi:hypothetical protein
MKRLSSNVDCRPAKIRCRRKAVNDYDFTLADLLAVDAAQVDTLPLEIKLQILELLGSDMYGKVTHDYCRTDTLMLKERRYKAYFNSRPFDYCVEKDTKLARYTKHRGADELTRLPLLADRLFNTYLFTHDDSYTMKDDVMLKHFFCDIDITHLPTLIDGEFDVYDDYMTDKHMFARDRLLQIYLDVAPVPAQCYKELCRVAYTIETIVNFQSAENKLKNLCMVNANDMYYVFKAQNVCVPECFQPLTLRKILALNTECIQNISYRISLYCYLCNRDNLNVDTARLIYNTYTWYYKRSVIFCHYCSSALIYKNNP